MERCEVLIVGGGPAGATCAARLHAAGVDVLLVDARTFPRDKVCAGWITPAVLTTLDLAPGTYRRGRILQEIRGFRTGLGDGKLREIRYERTVSYAIRRSEFDYYLLKQSKARHQLGVRVRTLERNAGGWLVNGAIQAQLVVGAGGHLCPVARQLGARFGAEAVILAQAGEWELTPEEERLCPVAADTPQLVFCRDFKGYGWLLRKGRLLNSGFGRLDRDAFLQHLHGFRDWVSARGVVVPDTVTFQGHAYLAAQPPSRQRIADGALLIGDAAGLASAQSGEGILPAIISAILAAETILAARGDYRSERLAPYVARLNERYRHQERLAALPLLPAKLTHWLGARLFAIPAFVRHVVLDRHFLHLDEQ